LLTVGAIAQSEKIIIREWLAIPAQKSLNYPVFHQHENIQGKTFSDENLLNFEHFNLSDHFPAENEVFAVRDGNQLKWTPVKAGENGYIIAGAKSDQPQIAYLATYIWAERWMQASLEISSPYMLKAWLGNEKIGSKTKINEDAEKTGKVSKDLKLERGKHLLVVKTLMPPGHEPDWRISASLEIKEPFGSDEVEFTLDPVNRKNISHIMDGVKISNVSLSHDGKYYSISYRQSQPPGDDSESWTEIKRSDNRQLVHSFRHARVSQIRWLPNSNRLSYLATQKEKSTIYLFDLRIGKHQAFAAGCGKAIRISLGAQ
jgi:hypothetical protein